MIRSLIIGMAAGFLLTTNMLIAGEEIDGVITSFKRFDLADLALCQECKEVDSQVVESHAHHDDGKECHVEHRSTKKDGQSHKELADHTEDHQHKEGHQHKKGHNDSGHSSDSDESIHGSD